MPSGYWTTGKRKLAQLGRAQISGCATIDLDLDPTVAVEILLVEHDKLATTEAFLTEGDAAGLVVEPRRKLDYLGYLVLGGRTGAQRSAARQCDEHQ
jgi:hypothetical protein